jgi:hypothetical protein
MEIKQLGQDILNQNANVDSGEYFGYSVSIEQPW